MLEQDGQLGLISQIVVASASSLSTKLVSTDVHHPEDAETRCRLHGRATSECNVCPDRLV
jgi:hypothetical protein